MYFRVALETYKYRRYKKTDLTRNGLLKQCFTFRSKFTAADFKIMVKRFLCISERYILTMINALKHWALNQIHSNVTQGQRNGNG